MQKYQDNVVQNKSGVLAPLAGAVVTIANTSGGSSTMYSDNGSTVVPSVTTDQNGYFSFYAADGIYTITITGAGTIVTRAGVELQNTATLDADIAARPTSATLAASGGAALVGSNDGSGGSLWTTVAGFIAKILSSAGSSVVGFIQAGTGAVARYAEDKLRESCTPEDFGAVGDGVADDTAACQSWATYCVANNKAMEIKNKYKVTSTISITGKWRIVGSGSVITSLDIPIFTFNINTTTVNGWLIDGPTFIGPASVNPASCALRFIGDNVAFVQHGRCRAYSQGFNAFLKDEKVARTTSFGLEGMLNWNIWDVSIASAMSYGYWCTQGSGTGNVWGGIVTLTSAGAAVLFFDGNGCVVGDIIVGGQYGCTGGGGIVIKVGDNTVYRTQFDLSKAQFDAGCTIPIQCSSVGATYYTNINVSGNNLGGASILGSGMQPLRNSIVEDRDVSRWEAGKAITSGVVGAISINCFAVDFTNGSYGAAQFRITANGLLGGVSSHSSCMDFTIKEAAGVLTVETLDSYIGATNGFTFSITTIGTSATIALTATSAAGGTKLNVTIKGTGDIFKISRL